MRDFRAPNEPVAIAVQAIRRHMNLSQAELAALIGVKQNTLSQHERGRVKPSAQTIIKLLILTRKMPNSHPSDSGPLISFLAEQLGLSERAVIMFIGLDQADLLDAMAAKSDEIDEIGADLKARGLELDAEEKLLAETEAVDRSREVKGE